MDLSETSSNDLLDAIFDNLPDPKSDTLDQEKWNVCTRSIMELRTRAIAGRDVTLLGRIHVLIREMETVAQAIAFNANRAVQSKPALYVSREVKA